MGMEDAANHAAELPRAKTSENGPDFKLFQDILIVPAGLVAEIIQV